MSTQDDAATSAAARSPVLFAVTIFASATLVFLVEPMIAKLVLPLLGGGPSIWNTSLAFFQTALLAGYGYAHLLQRVRSIRSQALIHLGALVLAALVLPLHVTGVFGAPSSDHPALWLLGVLTVTIGAPFAVLSATAPLVQAWHARTLHADTGSEPYALYAASNLGSLIALLAYPILVEPLSTLRGQAVGWSLGYGAFILLMGGLMVFVTRTAGQTAPARETAKADDPAPTWRNRLTWVVLAAIPSSLMMGVTTHLTTDVASAPFIWVVPLALYLITFIIAFSAKPAMSEQTTLILQAAAVAACASILPFASSGLLLQLFVHLSAFFLTALMCHQALVARRPTPRHLTEFYLLMSLGGVLGGGFNAFLAPVIFNNVWEYPLVLALACLVRPWGDRKVEPAHWVLFALGCLAAAGAPLATMAAYNAEIAKATILTMTGHDLMLMLVKVFLATAVVCAFLVRSRGLVFFGLIAIISLGAEGSGDKIDVLKSWRSFFGVVRQSELTLPSLGGQVRMLSHGTTLHGAQAQDPRWRCKPMVYYAAETPIGQVFMQRRAQKPALRIGAVGLGTGAVAAYTRPGDHLTFFEIDPLVIRIATDPAHFSYTTECAKGQVDYVLGDARLTLAKQAKGQFDILLIDAFSSDSVPAHLLTVEAMEGYLTHLKPDGVLILHLSNRNLDLRSPAMAVAYAAGGEALLQRHDAAKTAPMLWESSEDALIVARNDKALAAFAADPRWKPTEPVLVRPWTDDYTNLVGALYGRFKERWSWLP
ncbi:fused MFS/spermidine synthase [Phenylobacterium sp. 20VBR1]|uniref:Fused MFS/spermidine synthase n=1 Tax=Phenylobacterium glaciei TaxID=2803784 RepID=A0A941D1U5_9CAUL|nr:fused MFS/spermidine synthase [Phenylobacterium glaciei]MBR7619929.1 fused MFS/spermidine synthase [Phenylobacterium glaciei]